MPNLKSYIFIASIFLTIGLLNYFNKVQLVSNTGKKSPYVKNRFWNKGVFFQTWNGDGLGGYHSYEKLNLANTNFTVFEIEVLHENIKE